MGLLDLLEETTPATPGSNIVRLYSDSADFGRLKVKLPDGLVYPLSEIGHIKNYLINSGLEYAQRQVPGTLTSYFALATARHNICDTWQSTPENTNAQYQRIDTGGAGTPETGLDARFYGKIKKITNAGKVHILQLLENDRMANLRGRVVRFQVKMKRTVASSLTVRLTAFQLNSSGTADAMPATFISAHNGAGTDPTLGTNLNYVAPEANSAENGTITGNGITCTLGTSWVRYSGVWTVPATCRNFAIMIVSDAQLAINDEYNWGEAGLFDGSYIADWNPPDPGLEYLACARYFQKTFLRETAPAQAAGVTTGCLRAILGKAGATALAAQFHWRFRVPMLKTPTIVTYNPASANGEVRQISGTAADLTATASANVGQESADITATGAAAGAVGDQVGVHAQADASF